MFAALSVGISSEVLAYQIIVLAWKSIQMVETENNFDCELTQTE